MMHRILTGAVAALGLAVLPTSASAIVGGTDAPAGKYPAVANVTIANAFGCTGTLIARDWVITAGHCSSITGGTGIATPVAFAPSAFNVVVGTAAGSGAGGERLTVDRVVIPGQYLATQGFDTSLLHLAAPAKTTPTPVAGVGFEGLFKPGVLTEVAGFGVTKEGGEAPATLQQVRLPIVPDAGCAATYSSFEAATQLCAGYDEGGRDSCQGDSGGPMFSRTTDGVVRLVGATSYGDGCAKPKTPGVYARVSDNTLREFIRANAPAGVVDAKAGDDTTPAQTYDASTKTVTTAKPTSPAAGPAPAAAGPTAPASMTTRSGLRVSLAADRTRRSTLRSRGLRFRLRCSVACTARVVLRVDAKTAKRLGRSSRSVATATVRRSGAGRSTVTLKLSHALARRLTERRGAVLRLEATVAKRTGDARAKLSRRVVLTGR